MLSNLLHSIYNAFEGGINNQNVPPLSIRDSYVDIDPNTPECTIQQGNLC
jgi:hypothetical protein